MPRLTIEQARSLCADALRRAGAAPAPAASLARALIDAEASGQQHLGIAHLPDHLDAIRQGRIRGDAEPVLSRPAPAVIASDAGAGIAQLGFDMAFDDLVAAARTFGLALFSQHNAYTCGALGWFAARLAREGLVAIAATNGPALLAGSGGSRPVFCTNPLAFAAPRAGGTPLLIDQASSETAFVNIRKAARDGRPLPPGWALDAEGMPTTDAGEAAKGALVAFGGARGANIALMVEVLAAGLTRANWSLDAPAFSSGAQSPGSGLLVIAIDPKVLDPDFDARLDAQLDRLESGYGVHVPGKAKEAARRAAIAEGIDIDGALLERLANS